MLHVEYCWQSYPNEGYGYSNVQSIPVYPGMHSVLKLENVLYV